MRIYQRIGQWEPPPEDVLITFCKYVYYTSLRRGRTIDKNGYQRVWRFHLGRIDIVLNLPAQNGSIFA